MLLNAVIIGIHLTASVVLIGFILLHAGRGGGLSDMFGGAGGGEWPARRSSRRTSTALPWSWRSCSRSRASPAVDAPRLTAGPFAGLPTASPEIALSLSHVVNYPRRFQLVLVFGAVRKL